MYQRSSVEVGRSLPTSSDVTNQSPGLLSRRPDTLREKLTRPRYFLLLKDVLSNFLENLPLSDLRNVGFPQDGEPQHKISHITFQQQVIGLGKSAAEIYEILKHVYGCDTLSQTQAFEWNRRFRESRESVEDDKCSGCPQTSCTAKNVKKVSAAVYDVKSTSQAELTDKSKNGSQKRFDGFNFSKEAIKTTELESPFTSYHTTPKGGAVKLARRDFSDIWCLTHDIAATSS
ncbi:hypothetical protein TNCV_4758431 [Trichonephila clavipes]|nr:hypothetical protein TNCV_4758431 [Trichonephila clavipes]